MIPLRRRLLIFSVLGGLFLAAAPLRGDQPSTVSSTTARQDFETYLAGLKEKAENGDAEACRQLAVHYEVEGNSAETSRWISRYVALSEKKANEGDVAAMVDLGKLFYVGSRFYPKNQEQARGWFVRAAEGGNAVAQYQMADMAARGEGGPRDEALAKRYYEQALASWKKEAEAGDTKAAFWAGLLYEKGLVAGSSPDKSVPYLLQAADSGNVKAQILLAFKYRDGEGVTKDAAKAVEWYEKAAERKDLGAMMELGIMFRDGNGVPKDEEKARSWFARGAELNDPFSMMALADMMMAQPPSEEQALAALSLYRKAAAAGYVPAAIQAAELLQNGKGGEQDADEAFRLLRQTVDATGDPRAMYMLAQLYYAKGDDSQADSLVKASAQGAYLPAMNRMARLHLLPDSTLSWNPVLSYYYWHQAGMLGDGKAAAAASRLLWGSVIVLAALIFLVIWRFQRFAARRLAEQDAQEKASSDDA